MSLLGLLNYYILRWFHIRLAKIIDTKTGNFIKWKIIKGIHPHEGWIDKDKDK